MATYTYDIAKSGFNRTVRVYKDGNLIYTGTPSSTAAEDLLVQEAKVALRDDEGPGIANITRQAVPTSPPPPPTPPPPPPSPLPPAPAATITNVTSAKPAGKGIEGIITSISKQLATIESGIDNIYYGNKLKTGGIKIPGTKGKVNGILPIAQEIAKIDLCNILFFVLQNTDLNKVAGKDSKTGKKLQQLKDKAKKLSNDLDSGQLTNKLISPEKLKSINQSLNELTNGIDGDVIAVVPQLANAKNYIDDVTGTINQYSSLNTIPNADVQRIMSKIRGVQATVQSISTISSAQDLLDLASKAANINLNQQIQQLQKIINPAQLLPAFRRISTLLKGINQMALKLLNFVRVLQTITKVAQAIVKVLTIVVNLLKLIPIPNIVTVVALTQKFSDILQKVNTFLDTAKKRLTEIAKLIELLYSFIVEIVAKITQLLDILQTIITNLETCAATANSPIIDDLKDTKNTLNNTITKLQTFTANYASALNSRNKQVDSGYTLEIIEEELADEGIKNKRRKAIALDSRGVLVAETELTFATDTYTLFEELKLILRNKGLISDTGFATPGIVEIDLNEDELYKSIGLTNEADLVKTTAEMNAEVSSFVNGIKKGGRKFKRRISQISAQFATQSAKQLKSGAKDGSFKGGVSSKVPVRVSGPKVSTGKDVEEEPAPAAVQTVRTTPTIPVTNTPAPPKFNPNDRRLLTEREKAQYLRESQSRNQHTARKAKGKLYDDAEARAGR